jgi:hypothetical protein
LGPRDRHRQLAVAWQGNQPASAFSRPAAQAQAPAADLCGKPDAGAKVTFAGQELVRIAGTKL